MRFILLIVSIFFHPISKAEISHSISVEKISDSLHILKGIEYSTSIGLVSTDDGLVLIDPMPGKAQLNELQRVISELYDKPIIYILNTHDHEDHTGGNNFFDKQGSKLIDSSFIIKGIQQISVNSHTSKDNIYYIKKSNSIFVGDVFDSSWHPTFYSGGIKGFNAAIGHILAFGNEDSLIIPGHGQPANKTALREFRKNTLEWVQHIGELHRQDWSVDRIMKNSKTKDILNKFNTTNKASFIPERAFKRFIERTVVIVSKEGGI